MFLDRDGTINKYVGFLRDIDAFELIDGVAEAVRRINVSGYFSIVVTNQPVIARGEVFLCTATGNPQQNGDTAGVGRGVSGCHLLLPTSPS